MRAIAPAHPSGFDIIRVPGGHTEVLTRGPLAPFVPRLCDVLEHGLGADCPAGSTFSKTTKGKLRLRAPRLIPRGSQMEIGVQVHNASGADWDGPGLAPLMLIAQFQNLDGFVQPKLAGTLALAQPVAAGETQSVTMAITVPAERLPMWLSLDLIDGHGRRARDAGVSCARRLVLAT